MHEFLNKFFKPKSPTLQAAEEAVRYVNEIIVKSSTRLRISPDNDGFSDYERPDQLVPVMKGIGGSTLDNDQWINRDKAFKQKVMGTRDAMKTKIKQRVESGESEFLAEFKSMIFISRKYSLGNCEEMAYQALNYILQKKPEIYAEIFHIKDRDHAFVVLNRLPDSDPAKPETWGPQAVVCDPWDKKAYPASECLNQLKVHSEHTWERTMAAPFDPNRHVLVATGVNTDVLRDEIRLDNERIAKMKAEKEVEVKEIKKPGK